MSQSITAGGFSAVARCFFIVLMLVPLLGFAEIWPLSSALTTAMTLLFSGVVCAMAYWNSSRQFVYFNKAGVFLILLGLALVISVMANEYELSATWRWYFISLSMAIFALATACELRQIDSNEYFRILVGSLWFGCAVYSFISLAHYYNLVPSLFPEPTASGGRLTGAWQQPNLTTTMGWLGVLSAAALFNGSKRKPLWYGSILLFGWTLACAASRMSWLMAAGLVALALVSWAPRYRAVESSSIRNNTVLGVVVVVALLIIVPPINEWIRTWLTSIGVLEQMSSSSLMSRDLFQDSARLSELSKILVAFQSFSLYEWFFGVGPGNYSWFSYATDLDSPPEGLVNATWSHSHNLFTMVFVELGLIGFFALIALLVAIAGTVLSRKINESTFFSIGGIGLLFIHSNLEFPLWDLWFLVLLCFFLANIFPVRAYKIDSSWLKPAVGTIILSMIVALLFNVGSQYARIVSVALNPERDQEDFQTLSILANDSLLGPYAILRKYRDFAPETYNLDWQLREVRRMKLWQPLDLVVLREYSLLVLRGNIDEACSIAEDAAYRYPHSAPIMLDHAFLAGSVQPQEITDLLECIEQGLAPRGETISSVQLKNESRMAN